ncbi:iron chaperone [Maritalea sp.]|uniref:iron chaperone n=1 Tax=Maritalea sp. TaxID=2003361 RepID=UPI003EF8563C
MLSDAKSPEEYIAQLPSDWRRETLLELRQLILDCDSKLDETINYKMLAYGIGENNFCHLNAQKNYVSIYFGDIDKIDPEHQLLAGLNLGKGCIRFTKSKNIPETKIDQFIKEANKLWRSGVDIEC